MTKLNIIKELDTTTKPGKTIVKIKLNIPESQRTNLTIYQIFSKDVATYNQIQFIDDSNAQRIINDKDPVIGWYFNESKGNETIEYEVPGNNGGGIIIITQEPILFNEGELIINYREGSCQAGEAYLFEIDDLVDSKIYTPGSGRLYKVCVAHTGKSLQEGTGFANAQHLFNYTNKGNMSMTKPMTKSLDISISDTKLVWDVKVQAKNPTGDYSCLGSMARR